MFVGDRCGQAEAAIEFYTSVFGESAVGDLARYGPNHEPDEEGTVVYGEFSLEGQRFAAMDSTHEHDFAFNEAVSLAVACEAQPAVDSLWERLTSGGGAEAQCGWLRDRYGASRQIVPTVLPELLRAEGREIAPGHQAHASDAVARHRGARGGLRRVGRGCQPQEARPEKAGYANGSPTA